ncbi:MAG: ABC transporter permease DevC [Crocosphaera sp.]|nr:ABC transporter permease DevC [Crocosphaera sp.]
MKAPLAWLQLSHKKTRLLVALAGIAFADLLMFIQLGFQAALFESNVKLHKSFKGDIFLISPNADASVTMKPFSRRRIYQSLSIEGVKSITYVYMDFSIWKNPIDKSTRGVLIFGLNPDSNPLELPGLSNKINAIKQKDVYLFDELSRSEFGPIPSLIQEKETVTTEMENHRIKVGGLFALGASFAADGNLITSDTNFHRLFPNRDPSLIDIGVVYINNNAQLELVQKALKEKLPNDVRVLSKTEFIQWEKDYWKDSTAIGFIFTMGTGIGFLVGILIVYQILYTDVSDHLSEYATLKAIGYKNNYFLIVVFQEAIILAILGYIPGISITIGFYSLAAGATSLPIIMTLNRAITVFILTLIMCFISGLIAIRRLDEADPADIF